jgi:hypothetical protein
LLKTSNYSARVVERGALHHTLLAVLARASRGLKRLFLVSLSRYENKIPAFRGKAKTCGKKLGFYETIDP